MEFNDMLSQDRNESMKSKLEVITKRFGQVVKKDQDTIFKIRTRIFNKEPISKEDYENVVEIYQKYF